LHESHINIGSVFFLLTGISNLYNDKVMARGSYSC